MNKIFGLRKAMMLLMLVAVMLLVSSCEASEEVPVSSVEIASAVPIVDVPTVDESDVSDLPDVVEEFAEEDAGSVEEDTGEFRVGAVYLERLFMTYGELKGVLGVHEVVFEYSSGYYVMDTSGAAYCFRAKDWQESDADTCYRLEGKMGVFVPGLSEPMDLDVFVGRLYSEAYDAYYEVCEDGHLDRNAIADRYAMVYFGGDDGSGKEGSGFGAMIRVALPDGEDVIYPDALAWVSITAG